MSYPENKIGAQLGLTAARAFAANDRLNQLLIERLDPAAWKAKPPGGVRPIVAIFTHMHNVRTKWIRLNAPRLGVPAQLSRALCTPQQAQEALAESAALCSEMLAEALGGSGVITKFCRDGWARPLADWSGHAVLHARPRSPPSWAGLFDRGGAWILAAHRSCIRTVGLGSAKKEEKADQLSLR